MTNIIIAAHHSIVAALHCHLRLLFNNKCLHTLTLPGLSCHKEWGTVSHSMNESFVHAWEFLGKQSEKKNTGYCRRSKLTFVRNNDA